ncbi:hypothetical protein [Luteibacter sp.]|jgi:hypothetical protein|uniref:hypothetical protein n=1 Tax=Luteibacter sp. TaxID=1886636 RepID=UPI002F3E8BE6
MLTGIGFIRTELPAVYTNDPRAADLCTSYMGERWLKVSDHQTQIIEIEFDGRSRATFHVYGGIVPSDGVIIRSKLVAASEVLVVQLDAYYTLSARRFTYEPFGLNGRNRFDITDKQIVDGFLSKLHRLVDALTTGRGESAFVRYTGRRSGLIFLARITISSTAYFATLVAARYCNGDICTILPAHLHEFTNILAPGAFVVTYATLRLLHI